MRPCLVQSTMLQLGSLLHQHVRDIARRCAVVPWHAQWSILCEETSRRTWCGASVEVLIRLWRTPCDARRAQVKLPFVPTLQGYHSQEATPWPATMASAADSRRSKSPAQLAIRLGWRQDSPAPRAARHVDLDQRNDENAQKAMFSSVKYRHTRNFTGALATSTTVLPTTACLDVMQRDVLGTSS